jgi:hypothetical protein
MGLGRAVWDNVQSNGLKSKLRKCQKSLCECLAEWIDDQMNNPHHGLVNRFLRMLGPDAVQSGIPEHQGAIERQQQALREGLDMYNDNGCPSGGIPAATRQYAYAKTPTVEDWEKLHGKPMPARSTLERWGWGLLGVGSLIAAGVLLFVPVDGPAGEAAAGLAALKFLKLAF